MKAWNEEKAHPTQNSAGGGLGGAAPAGAPGGGVLAASQGVVSGAQSGGNAASSGGAPTHTGTTVAQSTPPAGSGRGGYRAGLEWAAALELTIATNGAEPYKSQPKELFPQLITPQQIDSARRSAVRA